MRVYGHFIKGREISGESARRGEVFAPASGQVQASVAFAGKAECNAAVHAALEAFPGWSATPLQKRARVMFAFRELVEKHLEEIALIITREHGKTIADARGDVRRGLDVVDFCCGIPHQLKGAYSNRAGPGIDVFSLNQPLGVCLGITPFNFPAMIPMWMFAVAIACGNSFVLKPSEKDPGAPLRLAELMHEAGLPEGVLNVVNGDGATVEALLADPHIQAVSFVGSSQIAASVQKRATAAHKRVQAFGGAKNHMVVLADADLDNAVNQVVGAAYGSAGERCMAISVLVGVGDALSEELAARIERRIRTLRIGPPEDPQSDYGPLVSAAHKARVCAWIEEARKEGANLRLDGRKLEHHGDPRGYYLGPTLIDSVRPDMRSYREEIFGPVLQIISAQDFDEAIALPSRHPYGNGVSLFTRSGAAAQHFIEKVQVGMVGVNVPIPVPVAYHSFGGWKQSFFGDINQHGPEGVRFFTRIKTVTQRWPKDAAASDFTLPTL